VDNVYRTEVLQVPVLVRVQDLSLGCTYLVAVHLNVMYCVQNRMIQVPAHRHPSVPQSVSPSARTHLVLIHLQELARQGQEVGGVLAEKGHQVSGSQAPRAPGPRGVGVALQQAEVLLIAR
jgi:hypothetical protein